METISSLYQQQIDYNSNKSPYIKDFRKNPYSFLKARYYMLNASLVVYFLQNTSIHANNLTKAYICLGFFSAFLLAIPIDSLNYIALFLIFSKGILDWADGHFARIKNQTSLTGHILDVYGARVHSLTFFIGLGFYEFFYLENILFLALLFVYPFFYGTLLTKFSNQYILDEISSDLVAKENINQESALTPKERYKEIYSFFVSFLDDRSRTIDFVLLLILIELLGGPALSWIFFIGLCIKWTILWAGSFIFSSQHLSADKILASKLKNKANE